MGPVALALAYVNRLMDTDIGDRQATAGEVEGVRVWLTARRGDEPYEVCRDAAREVVEELGLAATVHANGNATYSYPLKMGTLLRLAKLNLEERVRRAKRD